jgi:hypothetical protein
MQGGKDVAAMEPRVASLDKVHLKVHRKRSGETAVVVRELQSRCQSCQLDRQASKSIVKGQEMQPAVTATVCYQAYVKRTL